VANLLLPLFEANPEHWETLSYLNLDPDDARSSLQDYLRNWYDNAPAAHRSFIADVLALLRAPPTITVADAGMATSPATPPRDNGL